MALSDEKREQVKALLATGLAKNDVAKKCRISWETVDRISKQEPDKIESYREDKKKELIDKLWDNIVEAQELGFQMIKEAKQGIRDIPLGQISTYLGTIYDKRALMNNESTNNTQMTVKLEGDLDEWAN